MKNQLRGLGGIQSLVLLVVIGGLLGSVALYAVSVISHISKAEQDAADPPIIEEYGEWPPKGWRRGPLFFGTAGNYYICRTTTTDDQGIDTVSHWRVDVLSRAKNIVVYIYTYYGEDSQTTAEKKSIVYEQDLRRHTTKKNGVLEDYKILEAPPEEQVKIVFEGKTYNCRSYTFDGFTSVVWQGVLMHAQGSSSVSELVEVRVAEFE